MIPFLTFDSSKSSDSSAFDDEDTKQQYLHPLQKYDVTVHRLPGRHYDADYLEKYRLIGDVEMDRIFELDSSDDDSNVGGNFSNTVQACSTIYSELKEMGDRGIVHGKLSSKQLAMYEFYKHYHDHIPKWVDWDQIQRGIDVYITYMPMVSHSLFFLSLVPGFSIPKIGEVLIQTRYLVPPSSTEQALNRLMDTGVFVFNVLLPDNGKGLSASALRPGGIGWTMALQVRALHAKVRRSILRKKKNKWDVHEFGVPINQEDMAATLLAFSANVLIGIEFISGRPLPNDSQSDYLALWRYIGWLLGIESEEDTEHLKDIFANSIRSDLIPLDPCGRRIDGRSDDTSIIHARATLESMVCHLMHPNENSAIIAKHLLSVGSAFKNSKKKGNKAPGESFNTLYRCFMCRRSIGEGLANALKLPKPNWSVKHFFAYALTYVILFNMRVYTLLIMKSERFRRRAYAFHLKAMQNVEKVFSEKHGQRMQAGAQRAMLGKKDKTTPTSSCPFALVMPPTNNDERHHAKG